jgi:predicted membrane-bound spermidine synthase
MVIRLCSSGSAVGSAAGRVYALSTAGSIGGILATSFVLLPRLGTEATLKLLCGATFLAGAAGLLRRRSLFSAAVLIPVPLMSSLPGLDWSRGALWMDESAYNLVRVVRRGNERLLELNNSSSVQTVQAAGGFSGYYYDAFALGPLLTPGRRMLVLGMGGAASIHATRITAPDIDVDAVEIDRKVVETASRWFDIRESSRLRIHIADARSWVAHDRGVYDLIEVDLYQGGPYIPFYLATEEFFHLVSGRMANHGVLMMNVFDAGPERELVFAVAATLRRVFPSVMSVRTQSANYMLVAFRQKVQPRTVRASLAGAPRMLCRYREMHDLVPPSGTPWFSDDRAPIEEITRRMLQYARAR